MDEKLQIAKGIRTAIRAGDMARMRDLLTEFPDMLTFDTAFGSWLHVAASAGRTEIVAYLINAGVDLDAHGGILDGSAINEAASAGHAEVVRRLLDAGAKLDTSDPVMNPLFGAIQEGSMEIVQLLIERGIDYRVSYTGESMKNMDAEAFAREQGQTKIADYLATLKASAKPTKS